MADPFGRAILDHARGNRTQPLCQRDGEWIRDHPIEEFYFQIHEANSDGLAWLVQHVDGPLLDVGAGAGRLALYFQEDYETVAIEVSDALVTAMEERGVDDPRRGDMFALTEDFPVDRFRSVLIVGTQLGLARSIAGVEDLLVDLAHITTADATLLVDNYDPAVIEDGEMLGYRRDVRPGLAFRTMHFEYEGDVGETLLFLLFGPDRLREATQGTPWSVSEVLGPAADQGYFRAALTKE